METLPDYNKITFPDFPGMPFEQICPDSPPEAIDLLKRFLLYNSQSRVSAKEVKIKSRISQLKLIIWLNIKGHSRPILFNGPAPTSRVSTPNPKEDAQTDI